MSISTIMGGGVDATSDGLSKVQQKMLATIEDPDMRSQLEMQYKLQRLSEMVQIFSNILKKVDDMNMSVIGNLK